MFFNWPAAGTNPTGGLRRTWLAEGGWHASGQVPNACFANVETHSAVGPELIRKVLVSKAHSVRPGNGDHIVKEGHEQLVGLHLSVHCFQGSVLAEGVESGHQGITLLPPFRLLHDVCSPVCVMPHIFGWLRIKHAHKGEALVRPWDTEKPLQHRLAAHGVKRTPSTETRVLSGSSSRAAVSKRTTLSAPDRVGKPPPSAGQSAAQPNGG